MEYLNNPAIMFGPDSINGLGVARNLGRNGVKVLCVTEEENSARSSEIAYSRYCERYYAVPQIERSKRVLSAFLCDVKRELQYPSVLFPCSDVFCIALSQLRDELNSELSDHYVTFGGSETIETLVNKRKFYQSLDKYAVSHPVTFFPRTSQDVENISKHIEYPIYIRPSITQLFTKFHKKGLIARSQSELMHQYRIASEFDTELMIQEIISGPATNMYGINGYFNQMHEPQGLFAYHRLREYPDFGMSSILESIPISDVLAMEEPVEGYLKKLGYHGIFDAEFKKDPRDGNFKLLEINARSWWQNSFPTRCGINLILMAYLDAIGRKMDYVDSYKTGVKWLFFANDLLSSLEVLHRRQTTVREWFSSFQRIVDYAYLSPDDLLPWIANLICAPRNYLHALGTDTLIRILETVLGKKLSPERMLASIDKRNGQFTEKSALESTAISRLRAH